MALDFKALEKTLRDRFPAAAARWTVFRDQHCLHVKREQILEVLRFLRDDSATRFAMLTDLTVIDYLKYPLEQLEKEDVPERFAVVYQLTSLEHGARLRVKTYVPEEPCEAPTATGLWPAAGWAEREAYDMYGVRFTGHPDLRRLLMPEDSPGHPLRKDYPLKGRGERDRFPKYTEIPER
jgi:NADH-quinone oxidoreductase subunit C